MNTSINTRFALLLALGSSACACNPSSDSSASFDIGMVSFAGYAPLYLAQEKGYFGDLDVQFHRIEDVASIRAGVANGKLEAYLATPDIAQDTDTKPLGRAVWAIDESSGGDGVVVGPGITELSQLRGKSVAAEPGLPPNFVLLYTLHEHGLSAADVSFEDMTTQNAATAFIAGSVEAAGVYEPYLSQAKANREGSSIVISSADTPGLIVDLIFASDTALNSRADDIRKLIAGWEKAVDFIESNPDEANAIMAAAFNLEVAKFQEIAGGVNWLDADDNHRLFGSADEPGPLFSAFDTVNDVLRRNRATTYDADARDYLTHDFLPSR